MKSRIAVPVKSRAIDKRYHISVYDIVYVSTDICSLLRGKVIVNNGKGRYFVSLSDEPPKEAKAFDVRPVRISEKTLTALHFVKGEMDGQEYFMLYDMAWQPKLSVVAEEDDVEKSYYLVIGNDFSDAYLEYTGCTDNIDGLNDVGVLSKIRVKYVHDIQHLFKRITGCDITMDWDMLTEESPNWRDWIDTLYLTHEDRCHIIFNDKRTLLVMEITDEILDKFFWFPQSFIRQSLCEQLMYEDYRVTCLVSEGVYFKRYRNVSITRNYNTFTSSIKQIFLSPPRNIHCNLPQNINFIVIELDDDNMDIEDKERMFAKLLASPCES